MTTPAQTASSPVPRPSKWRVLRELAFFRVLPLAWPSIHKEMGEYLDLLQGRILNAGAGNRDLSPYLKGEVINQDIPEGLHNANIHVYSPLDRIPFEDNHFDGIICNAVLEHVKDPDAVLHEFHRVLKSGGLLYLCIPFMQPEHLDPTDFQRYTKDGLRTLVEKHGFTVERIGGVHSVYHTLAWILHQWLTSRRSVIYFFLRVLIYPWLYLLTRCSCTYVDSIASAYRVLARKEAAEPGPDPGPRDPT